MVVSFKNNQLLFFYHNFCAKLRKDFEIRRIKYQKTTPMAIISHPKTILPYLRPVKYHNFNATAMWKWLLQADFNIYTHGYTGSNFKVETYNAMLSLSVSKDLLKRRLNVKLSGNDLFNQGKSFGTFYFDHMIFSKTDDYDTRCVTFSLRYRFNVTPTKYRGTGAGNAEKNRL